jgi:hypothetical protein
MDGGGESAVLEVSSILPTVVFPYSPLWPIQTSPKHVSLVKVITTNICMNSMARQLEGEIEQLRGDLERVSLWDIIFLWQQYRGHFINFSTLIMPMCALQRWK